MSMLAVSGSSLVEEKMGVVSANPGDRVGLWGRGEATLTMAPIGLRRSNIGPRRSDTDDNRAEEKQH